MDILTYSVEIFSVTPAGDISNEVFLADLNGDGHLDLVVANQWTDTNTSVPLQVFLGDGKGGFTDGTQAIFGNNVPEMIGPRAHVVADFNGDGHPDIYFGDFGYDAAPFPGAFNTLLLSGGANGHYVNSGQVPVRSDLTHTVAAADVNGDGSVDISIGNLNNNSDQEPSYLLINDGHGNFAVSHALGADANIPHTASAFVDANGDGHLDLFLGGDLGGPTGDIGSEILLNDGHGNFFQSIAVPKEIGRIVVDAEVADLNGDGRQDLVLSETTAGSKGGYLQVLINNGHGFDDQTAAWLPGMPDGLVTTSGGWVYRALLADVNGDGRPDIFLSEGADPNLASPLFINDGAGHFLRTPISLPGFSQYDKVAIGDVNGDGLPDIVAVETNKAGEIIYVYSMHNSHSAQGDKAGDVLMGNSGPHIGCNLGNADELTLVGVRHFEMGWVV